MTSTHPAQWNGVSKFLHWTVAILVVTALAIGLGHDLFADSARRTAMGIHKSIGATVLILMSLRLLWNLLTPSPTRNVQTPVWQWALARIAHWLLYVTVIAQPIVGWAMSNSGGRPVSFWGLFDLPSIAAKNEALHEQLEGYHEQLGWAIIALLLIHIGAAIYHQWVLRDNLLARMIPGGKNPPPLA